MGSSGGHSSTLSSGGAAPRAVRRVAVDTRLGSALLVGVALALAVCGAAAFGRGYPREQLLRTLAWSVILLAAYTGWGTALAVWAGERGVAVALRCVWGLSSVTFLGALLASTSLLSRGSLQMLVVTGVLLLLAHLARDRPELGHALRARQRALRREPARALVVLVLCLLASVAILGGAADATSNPYDDDIAYIPMAKQLLERGTLDDPFSFRRLSTLGGQALQHAVLLLEAPLAQLNAFDRASCLLLALGLLAAQRVRGRRPPFFARVLSALLLVSLPNISINLASHYSGVAVFLGLYQTLERLPSPLSLGLRQRLARLLPLALTAALACTLRQNFIAFTAIFLAASQGFALWGRRRGEPLRPALAELLVCGGLVVAALAPWFFLSYRSSDTALFPLWPGTFNPDVALQSQPRAPSQVLHTLWQLWAASDPFVLLVLFALAGLCVREASRRRPVASQWLAAAAVLLATCVSLGLMDVGNLARYNFAYLAANVLFTWQVAATRSRSEPLLTVAFAAALVATLAHHQARTFEALDARLTALCELLRRTAPAQLEPPQAQAYRQLQELVPEGAPLLVMLDEPHHLDYSRNVIINLDLPGIASPAPGLPSFQGPEALGSYLRALGLRYVAFVNPERSRFAYRRSTWVSRVFDSETIWRVYAPYMLDTMDSVAALAQRRAPLLERDGMTLIDLGGKN